MLYFVYDHKSVQDQNGLKKSVSGQNHSIYLDVLI